VGRTTIAAAHLCCSDAVFYSNRSAALLAKEEWDKSLEDAERVGACCLECQRAGGTAGSAA
jgi:hypothetical protein